MDTQLSKIIRPLPPIPRTTSGFGAIGPYPFAAADRAVENLTEACVAFEGCCFQFRSTWQPHGAHANGTAKSHLARVFGKEVVI